MSRGRHNHCLTLCPVDGRWLALRSLLSGSYFERNLQRDDTLRYYFAGSGRISMRKDVCIVGTAASIVITAYSSAEYTKQMQDAARLLGIC